MEAQNHYKKGLWSEEEDRILLEYVRVHGRGQWNRIPRITGLRRGGKSCRLRWMNYLSPNVKRGDFSEEEDDLIIRLHNLLGNRWSLIAGRVPGRTDNQVKNHWNTHLCKKLGIKKGSRKVVDSSKKHSTAVEDAHNLPADSNSNIIFHNNDAEALGVMNSQNPMNAVEAYNNGESAQSLEFSGYHSNLNSPGFLDFVEENPPDLWWQGL